MTKLISFGIAILLFAGAYEIWSVWDQINNEKAENRRQLEAIDVVPEQLEGMPHELEPTLRIAQNLGATGLRNWLKAYGPKLQDPRKAWIELDYVVAVAREDPAEARKVFAEVKARTPEKSPILKRIKRLEKTYE